MRSSEERREGRESIKSASKVHFCGDRRIGKHWWGYQIAQSRTSGERQAYQFLCRGELIIDKSNCPRYLSAGNARIRSRPLRQGQRDNQLMRWKHRRRGKCRRARRIACTTSSTHIAHLQRINTVPITCTSETTDRHIKTGDRTSDSYRGSARARPQTMSSTTARGVRCNWLGARRSLCCQCHQTPESG